MSEEEVKALVEMKDMLKAENTKLKQKLEEQTKTYQKILREQQAEIDNLQRNCDVFNEKMNDAVEITAKLKQEKKDLIEWLKSIIDAENYNPLDWVQYDDDARYAVDKTIKVILERLGE